MIIHKIDVIGVPGFKTKNDTPISRNTDRPETFQIAFERMQPEAGDIHIRNHGCFIKTGEDARDFISLIGAKAARASRAV